MGLAGKPKDRIREQGSFVEIRQEVVRKFSKHLPSAGEKKTAIPGFSLHRRNAPMQCLPTTYEPSLAIFIQGRKRVSMGETVYLCDETNFLLTSVEVPVVSQIFASEDEHYMAIRLGLAMPMVREIISREDLPEGAMRGQKRGIAVGKITPELLSACSRLLDLLDAPKDIPFLSETIEREIVYRLLRGPQGERLRAIATSGDQSHRTAKAIGWLRANFDKPLRVEKLAEEARMGTSTLHHHFRALTAMSPLQYQKQLRLHAARDRMLNEGLDAASAAFEVGYESASQFSREYKRFFGQPPMRDVKERRAGEMSSVRA
jgi:AraC-like DNA-binding protein